MLVNTAAADDAARRGGVIPHNRNYVGTGRGALLRIDEFAPGAARFTHRTETLDHITLLSGEIDLELDSGEVVHLKSGDVLLNRGMMHTWVNNGSVPAVMVATMIDAKPPSSSARYWAPFFPVFPASEKKTSNENRTRGHRSAGLYRVICQ